MNPLQPKSRSNRNRLLAWTLLAALTPVLAGCFGAAAVGVGAGVMIAADRRPTETYLTDEGIQVRSGNRISEKLGDRAHVNVTSYNRSVLLTGEVPDAAAKAEAERLVGGVPNVKAISNELQIAGVSSLGSRSNDTYITSKVKARFIDAGKFAVNHVKVVTEAGVVYLLGLVTRGEAEAAVETARTTGGVLKVVRMFEIISDEAARQIDNHPAEAAAGATKKP
ncbi:MAG: BON domain-containing protein [Betaproteobacteria bacterium]|nr:BON domain-containing protein [Betaproteobacteria bacterium]